MSQEQPSLSLAQAHKHYLSYLALAWAGREAEGLPSLQAVDEAAHTSCGVRSGTQRRPVRAR